MADSVSSIPSIGGPAITGLEPVRKCPNGRIPNALKSQMLVVNTSVLCNDAPDSSVFDPLPLLAHSFSDSASSGRPFARSIKRVADIFISLTTLIALSPLLLLIAVLIKWTMGGPILFAHCRVGLRGQKFGCLKFRTMIEASDTALAELLKNDPVSLCEWRQTRKLRRDPRITPLGHILRRSSLDELPQLINVLRGEMSCVGPRPVVEDELAHYGKSVAYYKQMKPGLTGLWQVSGRSSVGYNRRVAFDRYYARHWSLMLDVSILARTIPAVFRYDDAA
ncbi:MAG: sugar transferase [Proteobacteria bacterium]|nr:sugar transferase [Pseudomonadota bacterium]